MALTSASTFDDAFAQLNNNCAWASDASKAAAWAEAAIWLMANRPSFSMKQNSQVSWANLQALIEAANKKAEAATAASTARRTSFARAKFPGRY